MNDLILSFAWGRRLTCPSGTRSSTTSLFPALLIQADPRGQNQVDKTHKQSLEATWLQNFLGSAAGQGSQLGE